MIRWDIDHHRDHLPDSSRKRCHDLEATTWAHANMVDPGGWFPEAHGRGH